MPSLQAIKELLCQKILAFLSLVFFYSISFAAETDKAHTRAPLAIAKIAGTCGVMDEMIDFQKKGELEGGDEFVTRFWKTEATRQGKTLQQFSDDCSKAIILYNKMWKNIEHNKQ